MRSSRREAAGDQDGVTYEEACKARSFAREVCQASKKSGKADPWQRIKYDGGGHGLFFAVDAFDHLDAEKLFEQAGAYERLRLGYTGIPMLRWSIPVEKEYVVNTPRRATP